MSLIKVSLSASNYYEIKQVKYGFRLEAKEFTDIQKKRKK